MSTDDCAGRKQAQIRGCWGSTIDDHASHTTVIFHHHNKDIFQCEEKHTAWMLAVPFPGTTDDGGDERSGRVWEKSKPAEVGVECWFSGRRYFPWPEPPRCEEDHSSGYTRLPRCVQRWKMKRWHGLNLKLNEKRKVRNRWENVRKTEVEEREEKNELNSKKTAVKVSGIGTQTHLAWNVIIESSLRMWGSDLINDDIIMAVEDFTNYRLYI